jgi:nucleoside-diphosphate-sugar epimerase
MIIGSGLLAKAFSEPFSQSQAVSIYAAGVSNSACTDPLEFARERTRLRESLQQAGHVDAFVYFGTCSVSDPEAKGTSYVQHKLAMEQLVAAHPRHLILRLPQVAGRTPNPHTLLNYLFARISRSEKFCLWRNALRNIIDVADIATIANHLISDPAMRNKMLNIANPVNYKMINIVNALESAVGKRAIYEIVERGSGCSIDIDPVRLLMNNAGIQFGVGYLERVIHRYYGKHEL